MITAGLVVLLAFGASALTYLALERLGRRAWVPMICRGIAWAALAILLLNMSCQVKGPDRRPLVLLDASLSMSGAEGKWASARDSALRWGEVRTFGDERVTTDTAPSRGRSMLAPALLSAAASDRPVIVVTDGEIDDALNIPSDILARSGVRLFRRAPSPDLAIVRVSGPSRVSAGDSIPLEFSVQASGEGQRDTVTVEVLAGGRRLARRLVRLRGERAGLARVIVPSRGLRPGDHVLRVRIAASGDAEPRTDERLHLVYIAATPGVTFLASPGDWDTRFLYRTLREVAQLPVKGYVRLDRDRWRTMADLRPATVAEIQRAARNADLLVLKGSVGTWASGTRARGIWTWSSGEVGRTPTVGDWYLSPNEDSPLAGAFLGQPVDSFPPAFQLEPREVSAGEWVALYAELGRRGPRRPAVLGSQEGRVHRVTVVADGLWRWAFRGGASEEVYRAWVALTTTWLLGSSEREGGAARPVEGVVANGRPLVFQWLGEKPPAVESISWSAGRVEGRDTLHFDAGGRAALWLAPGVYRYQLSSGGDGTIAVEQYSDELLARPITLAPHDASATGSRRQKPAREWIWLFGICVAALSGEWLARRRLGLR